MMRPIDYLTDARDILLRRYPYKGSELEGLIRRVPSSWRCMVGLHYPKFSYDAGRSFTEPGEPGYECSWCGDERALPVRIRLLVAFWNTRLGVWWLEHYR